jgi:ribosomal protein L30/L7E
MAYMCRLFRDAMLGLEGQCLKVLGLRLRYHTVVVVVMPGMVQVMINMTLDLVAMAFSPISLADHVFPHVVLAFLKWDVACLVFFLTLF